LGSEMETQSVEVRAFASEEQLNSAMQKKLDAIYAEIFARTAVADAFMARETAHQEVTRLKRAQAGLATRLRAVFDSIKAACSDVDAALVEDSAADITGKVKTVVALEAEHRSVSRAHSRIIEHVLPQAEIVELDRTADHLSAKAYAVREAATERIERTARMMAEAAAFEGGIVFDPANTLSGEMRRQAAEFDREAANYRMWAREREEQYRKMARELDSLGSVR